MSVTFGSMVAVACKLVRCTSVLAGLFIAIHVAVCARISIAAQLVGGAGWGDGRRRREKEGRREGGGRKVGGNGIACG